MKKTNLIALASLLLAALMLLSSCSLIGGASIKDVLDTDVLHVPTSAFTQGSVIADLEDCTFIDSKNELVYLSAREEVGINSYKKHIVYNVDANKIVFTVTESATSQLSVKLGSTQKDGKAYFYAKTTTLNLLDSGESQVLSVATALYDANGAKLADVARDTDVAVAQDLIYFGGKCYRANAEGTLAYAFDYSTLALFPALTGGSNEKYYYDFTSGITVYDKTLGVVSTYQLSRSALDVNALLLRNGNVLVQYYLLLSETEKNYDFVQNGEKYDLVTAVVNAKNGIAEELDCDYMIIDTSTLEGEGLDTEKISAEADVWKIEGRQLTTIHTALINESGKIKVLEEINGNRVMDIDYFAADRWLVSCPDRTYLVNAKGDVVGEVTKAQIFGKYLYADGVIYDANLTAVYDYAANGFAVKNAMENALLLTKSNGDVYLCTGSEPTLLVANDSNRTIVQVKKDYFAIYDTTAKKLEIYNEVGTKFFTLDNLVDFDAPFSALTQITLKDGAILLVGYEALTFQAVFYRFQ